MGRSEGLAHRTRGEADRPFRSGSFQLLYIMLIIGVEWDE